MATEALKKEAVPYSIGSMDVWELLKNNRQWIFEGIGVLLIGAIGKFLYSHFKKSEPKAVQQGTTGAGHVVNVNAPVTGNLTVGDGLANHPAAKSETPSNLPAVASTLAPSLSTVTAKEMSAPEQMHRNAMPEPTARNAPTEPQLGDDEFAVFRSLAAAGGTAFLNDIASNLRTVPLRVQHVLDRLCESGVAKRSGLGRRGKGQQYELTRAGMDFATKKGLI
jgi:hypothetical protein